MIDQLLKKHAKNFVTAERENGKLEGIHYHENGTIYVTDAHKLLAFHNVHQEEPHTVHYKSGKRMDISYPDVSRLIAGNYEQSFDFYMENIRDYVELVKLAHEMDSVGSLIFGKDNQMVFKVKQNNESFHLIFGDSFELLLGNANLKYEVEVINLQVLYFYHMLHFFKDSKVDKVTVSYRNRVSPVSFRSGNYEVLILPVRRY